MTALSTEQEYEAELLESNSGGADDSDHRSPHNLVSSPHPHQQQQGHPQQHNPHHIPPHQQHQQIPTPDARGDTDMTSTGGNGTSHASPATNPQSSVYGLFDTNFDSMFAAADPPKPTVGQGQQPGQQQDAGLSDLMRQYNQMPFGFATSNLR